MISVRTQLAWLVGGFVSLSLFALALFAAREDRRDKQADAVRSASHGLEVLSYTVEFHLREQNFGALRNLLKITTSDQRGPDFLGIEVQAPGRTIGDAHVDEAFVRRAEHAKDAIHEQRGDELFLAQPLFSDEGRVILLGHVSLTKTEAAVEHSRNRLIAGALALGSVITLGLFLALSRLVFRPLKQLEQKALLLGEGRLSERAEIEGGRELRELAVTLNRMAAALQSGRSQLELRVEERTRELQEANAKLEQLAVTDGLTGVFNHRRFQEALDQEVLRTMRKSRPLSVLMIDVDHFKRFNDEHGHPAGDELLRGLAATLQAQLRATDLLARYGGEEFAVILPETPPELARQVADRLLAAAQTLNEDRADRRVTISIGVATRRDNQGPEELLSAADSALYEAKHAGRNQVRTA